LDNMLALCLKAFEVDLWMLKISFLSNDKDLMLREQIRTCEWRSVCGVGLGYPIV
jgi:hypothetical protein